MAGPSRSVRKVSNALRLVFGPSSRIPLARTRSASDAWAARPSSPSSAKPAAKTTAKPKPLPAAWPMASIGSATTNATTSTPSGRSATDGTHGTSKTVGRVGWTG